MNPSHPLPPEVLLHMSAALAALVIGPFAIWTRRGRVQRHRLHRALGYAWVTMMLVACVSALFIRDHGLINIAGYTPIHLLVPLSLFGMFGAFRALLQGRIDLHRSRMQAVYFQACVGAGVFTLLPNRYLGQLVWFEWLGLPRPETGPTPSQWGQMLANGLGAVPLWAWLLLAIPPAVLAVRRLRRAPRIKTAQ